MTCVIGLIDKGNIYIGGDSAGAGNHNLSIRADEKVFKNNSFLMGFTTSFRMGQLLRYKFNPPEHSEYINTYNYMVTDFIDAVRNCLKDGGFAQKDLEQESGGTFLVGYKGRLFKIYNDYQVEETVDNYNAIGCGEQIALGSLYSTKNTPPRERIKIALEAAERYSTGVNRPFKIIKGGG